MEKFEQTKITNQTARDALKGFEGFTDDVEKSGKERDTELMDKQGFVEFNIPQAAEAFQKRYPVGLKMEQTSDGKYRFTPTNENWNEQDEEQADEDNFKDESQIEIVSPVGADGRKISEEELQKSREGLNAVGNAKIEKSAIEKIKDKQNQGGLLSQAEIALLNSEKIIGQETKEDRVVEKEIENKELAGDWENLETARELYFAEYQEFLRSGRLGRLRNALGLSPSGTREMPQELKEAKENYDQAKQLYTQGEWEISRAKLSADLSAPERNQAEAEIKNKIFNITVLDEMDYLQEAEAETFPPKQRGIFMKSYDKWSSLSKTKRLVYSTIMVAGVAGFASLAVPVSAGAAAIGMGGLAGKKLLRGTFGMLMSGLTGKIYDKATRGTQSRIEQTATDTAETARGDFNLNNLSEIEEQYQDALKQEQKGKRNLLVGKALAMGATGIGSVLGIGMLENAIAGDVPAGAGGVEPQRLKMKVPEQPSGGKTVTEGLLNSEKMAVDDIARNAQNAESYIETATKGDSVWTMAKDQLGKQYGEKFTGLNEAQQTDLIDAIKDEVAKNPSQFGLNNIDELKVGQKVDFTKVFADERGINKFFEEAGGLSKEATKNILAHNQTIKDWVTTHSDESLTSEKVEEILHPKSEMLTKNLANKDDWLIAKNEKISVFNEQTNAVINITIPKGVSILEQHNSLEINKSVEILWGDKTLSTELFFDEEGVLKIRGLKLLSPDNYFYETRTFEEAMEHLQKEVNFRPLNMEVLYEKATQQAEQNMAVKLDEFGGQFVKQEWAVLKEMSAEQALEGIEKFKSRGFFARLFSSDKTDPFGAWLQETTGTDYIGDSSDFAEFGNRQQLREYLRQAYKETGFARKGETIAQYLRRYETNNLASEMRKQYPVTAM